MDILIIMDSQKQAEDIAIRYCQENNIKLTIFKMLSNIWWKTKC